MWPQVSAASCLGMVIPQDPQECLSRKRGRTSQRRAGGTNKHFMSASCVFLTSQRPCKTPAISFSGKSMLHHLQDLLQLSQLVDGKTHFPVPAPHPHPHARHFPRPLWGHAPMGSVQGGEAQGPEHQWEGWAAVPLRTPFLDSQPLSTPKHPSPGEQGQDQDRRYHAPLGLERKM